MCLLLNNGFRIHTNIIYFVEGTFWLARGQHNFVPRLSLYIMMNVKTEIYHLKAIGIKT